MPKVSKKTAKLKRETTPARRAYVQSVWLCQLCGKRQATDCHEIARGAHREAALKYRAAWLAVCRTPCHDDLDDYEKWPISKQCAAKLVADPEHFDLKVINQLRGRAETALTLADVAQWLEVK